MLHAMMLLTLQNCLVPNDTRARVTISIGEDRTLGGVFAGRVVDVGGGDGAFTEVGDAAVAADVAVEFLDTHGEG